MAEEANENSTPKALGGVFAIVALIAGIYAMVEPMNQRIDFLTNELNKVNNRMINDHRECDKLHRSQESRIRALEVRLEERNECSKPEK
jgi:retron-type reverse transcriptase